MKSFHYRENLLDQCRDNFLSSTSKFNNKENSFEELLEMFSAGVGFSEISKKFSATKQSVSDIYEKYFRQLFFGKNIRQIRKYLKERETEKLAEDSFEKLDESDPLKIVTRRLIENGCNVRFVVGKDGSKTFSRTKIVVNGCLCSLHTTRNIFNPNSGTTNEYSQVRCSLKTLNETGFTIFYFCGEEQEALFVLPNRVLFTAYFGALAPPVVSMYLPINHPLDKSKSYGMVKWYLYKNAFKLISG